MSRHTWPEARRYVLPTLATGLALLPLRRRTGVAVISLAAAMCAFFRDPERPLTAGDGVLYSAADGFIAGIDDDVEEPWLPGGRALRIRTFLSVHNVHVNRSPYAAKVVRQEHVPGGFAPALFAGAGDNTRNRILLEGDSGPFVVVQISGSIARTIASWVRDGDTVQAGQRLGMIHFGSRTDVLLPVGSAEALVTVGQRVQGARTPLARYVGARESPHQDALAAVVTPAREGAAGARTPDAP